MKVDISRRFLGPVGPSFVGGVGVSPVVEMGFCSFTVF
jgi:hypothetical protein